MWSWYISMLHFGPFLPCVFLRMLGNLDRWTDGRTLTNAMSPSNFVGRENKVIPVYPPINFVEAGGIKSQPRGVSSVQSGSDSHHTWKHNVVKTHLVRTGIIIALPWPMTEGMLFWLCHFRSCNGRIQLFQQSALLCPLQPGESLQSCAKKGLIVGLKKPQGWEMGCACHPVHVFQCPASRTPRRGVSPSSRRGWLAWKVKHSVSTWRTPSFWSLVLAMTSSRNLASAVETLYSTIGGVHEMRSCYRRMVVKYNITTVTSWQKCVMITWSQLIVVWAPCPWSHRTVL